MTFCQATRNSRKKKPQILLLYGQMSSEICLLRVEKKQKNDRSAARIEIHLHSTHLCKIV